MTDIKFTEGIVLIETVTGKGFSEPQLQIYKSLLSDIPDSLFISGINKMLRERVFSNLPMPAEIREFCLGSIEDNIEFRIVNAVANIRKAVTKCGGYRTIAFDDPIIHRIIRDYGAWYDFCTITTEELENFLKFEVPKAYRIYAKNKVSNIPLFLTGRFKDEKITYIGDEEQAKKWQIAYCEKTGEVLPNNFKSISYIR